MHAGHSPLGMKMMLKAGWKPGDALGRRPGALVRVSRPCCRQLASPVLQGRLLIS